MYLCGIQDILSVRREFYARRLVSLQYTAFTVREKKCIRSAKYADNGVTKRCPSWHTRGVPGTTEGIIAVTGLMSLLIRSRTALYATVER